MSPLNITKIGALSSSSPEGDVSKIPKKGAPNSLLGVPKSGQCPKNKITKN